MRDEYGDWLFDSVSEDGDCEEHHVDHAQYDVEGGETIHRAYLAEQGLLQLMVLIELFVNGHVFKHSLCLAIFTGRHRS